MLDKTSEPGSGRPSVPPGRRSFRSSREALQPDDAPPPPPKAPKRRRRPLIATASGLLSFLGISAIALVVAWALGLQRVSAPGPLASDRVVAIQPGNEGSVADQLADAGVIDNRLLMKATLLLEGDRSQVRAGEYMFKQGASLRDVIDLLVSGKQILHAVTFPEGLTSEQVVDRLRDSDVLVGDIAKIPDEGTLMPDTYKFARGTTREQVIRSMQSEARKVLAEVWTQRAPDTVVHSSFEMLTLASIVEKETGRADERPRVAGVFVNRLNRSMPLQSDPTIVYGLVGGKGTLGRGILRSELDQKTPYNTYQIGGLPPGPICNPGKAALEAVANPSRTRDLYFVADGTGGHAFADTLDQHRANVAHWRQIEKDAKDRLTPEASPIAPILPKGNQRGDLGSGPAAVGGVDLDISGAAATPPARVTSFSVDRFAGSALLPALQPKGSAPSTSPAFNELDVEVAGVRSRSDPETWDIRSEDAFAEPARAGSGAGGPEGSEQSFPVSPQHLSDQRARAKAYGVGTGLNSVAFSSEPLASQNFAGTAPAPIRTPGRGKIIDASEGTSFDPLKDRSYDLTTAKVVPVLRALPPVQPLAVN